jgi:trehalose/maltose hydrolase-like predicted phosphorylase
VNLWQISEQTFDPTPRHLHSQETVYTIGNGYFCTRGAFEEGFIGANPGTLLFGVFDDIPVAKEELANVPDWLPIKLFVNGERFRFDQGQILAYQRTLDMQRGVLIRTVRWKSPGGAVINVTSERFASLADEHTGAIRYSVTATDQDLKIVLWASLNTAVGNYNVMHWETLDQGHEGNIIWLLSQTRMTAVQLAQTMSFTTHTIGFEQEIIDSDVSPTIRLRGILPAGKTLTAEKIAVMYTSRDGVEPVHAALKHHRNILAAAEPHAEPDIHQAVLSETTDPSPEVALPTRSIYQQLFAQHEVAWKQFWQIADILIEGDEQAQLGMRYSLYQLRINVPLHDTRYSIAAKGLTGFGYRGHIFHDTEIFMLPFFTYVMPDIARNLLLYRYHLLSAAREKAASNGYEGAQYPWESTLSGAETTPASIIHPETGEVIPVLNASLEIHITASIAHAVMEYWRVTGNDEFMQQYGAEIILSTAMFWASRAEWHETQNDYEITNVIGPDEWHEHVNNNAFTNYMAKHNILMGLSAWTWLQKSYPQKAQELAQRLHLNEQRFDHWRDVAEHMHFPQDKQTCLIEQFDGFFNLKPLDQSKYRGRTDSYQGILGVQAIQKYRIIKQADVLMLLTVLDDQFDLKTKRVNWDYYYPITDHDYGSSLTPAFHAILACELGLPDEAYKLFMKGALVDLQNLRGNTPEGVHVACTGAVWQAAVFGFAGLRTTAKGFTINPRLPDKWSRLAFTCLYRGQPVYFDLRK